MSLTDHQLGQDTTVFPGDDDRESLRHSLTHMDATVNNSLVTLLVLSFVSSDGVDALAK